MLHDPDPVQWAGEFLENVGAGSERVKTQLAVSSVGFLEDEQC